MERTESVIGKTYQAKPGYIHRRVAGSDVLISVGGSVANFNGYIELNASAAFIWDQLKESCSGKEIAGKLAAEFEIGLSQAEADTAEFLNDLLEQDMAVEV